MAKVAAMAMEKVDAKDREKIEAVRKVMRKQAPLSSKQAEYCNDACVERFLRAKGDNVKKAAKNLRAVLSWRESIGADHIIADEFSGELSEGMAYVAGHDDENRPVVMFKIKQDDYPKYQPQKSFVRFLVFTLEVAVASMNRFVDQLVLLFDASFFRSASAFLNLLMGTLKIVADYYPGRLHRAFVIDPPSLFSVMWKGVRPFVELAPATAVVCSLDFEDSLEDASFTAKGGQKTPSPLPSQQQQQFPRTPRPSFLQSPFTFRKDGQASRVERERESFLPFLRFYRRPYDEITYRAMMRRPLGGLIAIVAEDFRPMPAAQQPLRRHAGALHHQYQQHHHHHQHQHQRI